MPCTNCGYSAFQDYISPLPKHLAETNNPPLASEISSVEQILSGLHVEQDIESLQHEIVHVEEVLKALKVKKRKMEDSLVAGIRERRAICHTKDSSRNH
ncbi:hypothetical protein C8J56DRAFT_1022173, partial [Mycena floridula]